MMGRRLPIIGRERRMVNRLTEALHRTAQRHVDFEPIRETDYGATFRVQITDPDTTRTARVTVEIDPPAEGHRD